MGCCSACSCAGRGWHLERVSFRVLATDNREDKAGHQRTRPLGLGDVIDRLLVVVKVRLVELCAEAVRERTHALEQEGDAEEVDLVRVDHGVDARVADEGIVNAEAAWQPRADLGGRAPRAKLAARLGDACVEDGRRRAGQHSDARRRRSDSSRH